MTARLHRGRVRLTLDLFPERQPGHLTVSRNGAKVHIEWDHGILQSAPSVSGPWNGVIATSPFEETPAANTYYRTVSQ